MTCVTHPSAEATSFCRICGRAMCDDCKREHQGTVYCENCLAREMSAPAPGVTMGPPTGPIPGLAFGLGFIPGVGAIYNGQFAKGFVHIILFGLLINLAGHGELEPMVGLMIPAFLFYMAIEAHHTAKRRALGLPVDEWSGVFSSDGSTGLGAPGIPAPGAAAPMASTNRSGASARSGAAMFLIAIGAIILASNLGYLSISQIFRWWPLLLIGLGVSMLISRLSDDTPRGPQGGI